MAFDTITVYEDEQYTQPVTLYVTDMSAVGDWTSGTNGVTTIGTGADAQTFEAYEANPNWGNPFAMVEDPPPLVQNKPATATTPAITPNLRDKVYYIKPNMTMTVNFYVSSNTLHFGVAFRVAGTRLTKGYDSGSESANNNRALCFGVLRRKGVQSICAYMRVSDNSARVVWVSSNFWDGTAKIHTPSKTKNTTPSGYGGARAQANEGRTPQNIFSSINILSHTIGENGLHAYELRGNQLQTLYEKLWSSNILTKITNSVVKPTAGLLSLHMLPIQPTVAATGYNGIHVCGTAYNLGSSTYWVTEQIHDTGMFIRDISDSDGFTESFLDYSPYVSAALELPFCGIVPIDINKIMGGTIGVRYIIDILTGNCLAEVYFKDRAQPDKTLWQLYSRYSGNCAYHIPITADENGGKQMLGIFGGLSTIGMGAATGNPFLAMSGLTAASGAALTPNDVGMIGTFSQNVACLAGDLFIRLHLTVKDDLTIMNGEEDALQRISGLPAGVFGKVSDFVGSSEGLLQGQIHVEGVKASGAELQEIVSAFESGVIV